MATNSPALRIVDIGSIGIEVYGGHTDILNAVDVSDGKWIATASKDNEARLWRWNGELQDFEPFARFKVMLALSLPLVYLNHKMNPNF